MKRKFESKLIEWINDKNRKPLIIDGARQIGKTFLIKKFAEAHSKKFIYFDFIKQQDATQIANIEDFNKMKDTLQLAYNFRFDDLETIVVLFG